MLLMPGSLTLSRVNFSESRTGAGGAATADTRQSVIATTTQNTIGTAERRTVNLLLIDGKAGPRTFFP